MPTSGSITSVTFSGSNVAPGSTVQGTVTLASATSGSGAVISLSSSNSAVATVPASVTVAAGGTTGTFSVTGVTPGSVTITASMNGASRQSSALTVGGPQLASLVVSPSTVIGGADTTATVTLTDPAPAGGANVALSSDGTAVVPAVATVSAGGTSASFTVKTQEVSTPTNASIQASYGGVSAMATVVLTRTGVATANFGVTGPNVTETCTVINNGTGLDCTFNGSTSTAPGNITAYTWTWGVIGTPKTQTTTGPVFANPSFSCSMLPPPPPMPTESFSMTVTLQIHDDAGNVSAVTTDNGVRLIPQGSCGY